MYNITRLLLEHLTVKYHSLVMGKLKGDVYVDNKAIRIDEL